MFSKIQNIITAHYNSVGITEEYINYHCSTLDISRDQLKTFTIPDNVRWIGWYAFRGCTSLQSINIPNSVTEIGIRAFERCSALTSINIPDGVTKIDEDSISWCKSLSSITIPDSVTEIDQWAFWGCTSLKSIIIPDRVTEIGQKAFGRCTSLTSIFIPDSVTKIMMEAFEDCTSLMHIICNNPGLFTDVNIDQTKLISPTDYYKDLPKAIKPSGFNSNHVSSKELSLILKLQQEDYLPNWNTIATTFNERSMDQIRSLLHYFNKTNCMPGTENSILLKQKDEDPITLDGISMFLNPIEYTNLSMTAKNVVLRTKEKDSASFCSIQ